jgi:hypothetical protein
LDCAFDETGWQESSALEIGSEQTDSRLKEESHEGRSRKLRIVSGLVVL